MAKIFSNTEKIILASGSPRRKAYLKEMGLSFRVVPASIEEKCALGEEPKHYIRRLAQEKALCVAAKYPDCWIVSADTVVCLGNLLLEKPLDKEDAVKTLMTLSGQEHTVRTALCLHHNEKSVVKIRAVSTRVIFWDYTEDVAKSYVDSGEPMDKAGSYGIQGKGAFLVREIHGSYSNVVGLPLCEFIEMLSQCKLITN
jgi:septum formation protein